VSAHHAIIPTGVVPKDISESEKKIYDMIATRYIIQFFPPCIYDAIQYELKTQGYVFAGSGKAMAQPGWRSLAASDDKEEGTDKAIPSLMVGDVFSLPIYIIDSKKTKPPKRFTEGTLLAAMTNIWRFVSPDNPNRERLKECKGIGTPATRDGIIADLMATKSGKASIVPCIQKKGKELVPTDFGMNIIANIHESLTKADMTAEMEYHLAAIADGKMQLADFMKETTAMVLQNIAFAESSADSLAATSQGLRSGSEDVPPVECPLCHKTTLARKYSPKTKKHFWVCSEKSCVHPQSGKPMFYADYRSKPLIKLCPDCNHPLSKLHSKKTNQDYWFCPTCNQFKKVK